MKMLNLFEVIIAIVVAGMVYVLARTGAYWMMGQVDLINLDKILDRLPKTLRKTAKYLRSKKAKETFKDLAEAFTSLVTEEESIEPETKTEE